MLALCLVSCQKAPTVEEISDRLGELLEASYGVNVYLFGEGHETYERIYDPKASMKYHEAEGGQRYYYYYIEDEEIGTVLAYRTKAYGDDYEYLQVIDAAEPPANSVYQGEGSKFYCPIEYTPKEYEFYYDDTLPEDYDVVVIGEKYASVDAIKEYAETVYSAEYLAELYEALFTGAMVSDDLNTGLLTARYIEYETEDGKTWFMKSNNFEPLMSEQRIYDVSSAKILRGSTETRVRVEMNTYFESTPDDILPVTVNLVKQDGEWFLDSGTY